MDIKPGDDKILEKIRDRKKCIDSLKFNLRLLDGFLVNSRFADKDLEEILRAIHEDVRILEVYYASFC